MAALVPFTQLCLCRVRGSALPAGDQVDSGSGGVVRAGGGAGHLPASRHAGPERQPGGGGGGCGVTPASHSPDEGLRPIYSPMEHPEVDSLVVKHRWRKPGGLGPETNLAYPLLSSYILCIEIYCTVDG
jgi:hypothetical protein